MPVLIKCGQLLENMASVLTRLRTFGSSLLGRINKSAPVQQQRRGIPLGSVVQQLNQTREFSTTQKNTAAHKHDDHGHHKHDDHHGEHHDDHHHEFVEDPKDPYDGIGPYIPSPPKLDIILAKIIGALSVFWVLYWLRERGLIVLGLEAPHWEHGVGDTDSEEDDKDWDEDENDDELEEKLELYMRDPRYKNEPIDRKIRFHNTYLPRT
jgi:hypothetical protein